jgi:anti-sigma factor ChrR (cupin superfamily)
MNHPSDDQLLLLAYGELPSSEMAGVEAHVAGCSTCRAQLEGVERSRVALDVAMPRTRRRSAGWLVAALAAAAVIAAVAIPRSQAPTVPDGTWRPAPVWSATAGYVAGGRALVEIDAQLTRLEQERYYALPN